MVEGAVRHGTSMALEGNYVDSHGQSEIGFAITRLLGFDLLPRIKQVAYPFHCQGDKILRPGEGHATGCSATRSPP